MLPSRDPVFLDDCPDSRFSGGSSFITPTYFSYNSVRQLFELEDFGPSKSVERFRRMGVATEKQ
jgi:hypothetical protein